MLYTAVGSWQDGESGRVGGPGKGDTRILRSYGKEGMVEEIYEGTGGMKRLGEIEDTVGALRSYGREGMDEGFY